MDYVPLGRSGLRVSRICLGAFGFGDPAWQPWVLDDEGARPIIRRALELGINFFDTADMYSNGASERVLGKALREFARREEVVVCTKAFHPTGPSVNERGLSRRHLLEAIDRSLANLGMDHVDVYQIHRLDQSVPMEETLEALHDIVRAGKARYIAASNMLAWQFAKALGIQERRGWARFIAMQNQYNLVYREEEREMIPLCLAEGIGYTPYSPLARGFLAGKAGSARAQHDSFIARFHGGEADAAIRGRLQKVASHLGAAPARVALTWLLGRPGMTSPVVGATKLEHIEEAVAATASKLGDDDARLLEELYRPRSVLLHL
ncbi:MAG TPA: aldo/keto reductase [Burkholderiales bacterium]|nr:aldo/keto reductase [Burkholderiales bacterium]